MSLSPLEVVTFLERMVNLSVAKGPNMGYITADGALGSSVTLPVSQRAINLHVIVVKKVPRRDFYGISMNIHLS